MTDPRVAMKDAKEALVGGLFCDPVKAASARAELAAIGNAVRGDSVPPPPGSRDPRPLAEAIVGTWRNPMMTVTFSADGTASMKSALPGVDREARWSVDASGKLVADIAGTTEPAEAWIASDRLTVVLGGQSLAFVRVS
jgi:hypothetical protein